MAETRSDESFLAAAGSAKSLLAGIFPRGDDAQKILSTSSLKMHIWRAYLAVAATLSPLIEGQRLLTIPSAPFSADSSGQSLSLRDLGGIVVDSRHADAVNDAGKTLIPPTLRQFADTFQDDLSSTLGLDIPVLSGTPGAGNAPSIVLTLAEDVSQFLDVAGRSSSEGYSISASEEGITIAGASPLGVWWGTRTLLQAAVLNNLTFPYGSGVDAPGWGSRGVMLDGGRHYYPPEFVVELCTYLSYFKQNEFHLHLSDNMFNYNISLPQEEALNVYSGFRLLSDDPALAGLARLANESYTREQFDNMQQSCAARGVTIIPEIEAPAHALAIVRWKPELGLSDTPTMLNLSHPETIPTLKTIWSTLLPWFQSKTVSIGADEYSDSHVQDYVTYVNEMNKLIRAGSKDIRIWGTFPPSKGGGNITTDVAIQHWADFEDNAYFDYIQNGYQVLNSDQSAYIVLKFSPWFGQTLDKTWIFSGTPTLEPFAPNIFDRKNATNNAARDDPNILGHIAPLWNDWGHTASTFTEAYWAWRDTVPALADKQWGGSLTESEYDQVYPKLHPSAPGQNLDRAVASKSDLILEYQFGDETCGPDCVADTSGNDYHGALQGACEVRDEVLYLSGGCYLQTPLSSKGRNYTLSFWANPSSSAPATLFAGPDSTLKSGHDSYTNVTMLSGGHPYALNYSLPVDTWTFVRLAGSGLSTLLTVSGGADGADVTHEFNTRVETGRSATNAVVSNWVPMAFEAPLARIGEGFTGMIRNISLVGSA